MGWLSKLLNRGPKETTYADMLSGYSPIFSQFGQDIYASDVVQQAIGCIVREMKKLRFMHVRGDGADIIPVSGSVQKILNNPNELMTTSDFLEKVYWQLFFNYNAFIIPTYTTWTDRGVEKRNYTGLYPVAPSQVDFIEDAGNNLYIKMTFPNGYVTELPYEDVIHLRYNYSVNEYMGGNAQGQPDNRALLKTLEINNDLLNGVSAAMKSSFNINGVVKYKALLDKGKTEEAIHELEEKIKNNASGFLPLDLSAEYIPITRNIQMVDEKTLEFIDTKILRNFGVSIPILAGTYTKAEYEAFYQKTLEPLIIMTAQAFTKVLFTDREKSFGNRVEIFPKELIFLSTEQTIEVVKLLSDAGQMYDNEKRVAFGLMPMPELVGRRTMSLNYIDATIANEYQKGKNKNGNEGTEGDQE